MNHKRVSLYERLPEIYRLKDGQLSEVYRTKTTETAPDYQLRDYLALVEEVFGAIHENIESLYHDLFIETCDAWVIPYIGDLLGVSHLSGDAWTLRADVADTIALRRRKGTLGAIELLTYNLTEWGVHCVELRENMVWNQHLNHQRPDEGGAPPYSLPGVKRETVIRGGTVTLRDPAMLELLGTPFDPFAHVADVRPPVIGSIRYNLPNLAIFLWRLRAYRLQVTKPFALNVPAKVGEKGATFKVRFNINPIPPNNLSAPYVLADNVPAGQSVRLFNTNRFDLFNRSRKGVDSLNLTVTEPRISQLDETPGPIPMARLSENSPAGVPEEYLTVETYDATKTDLKTLDISEVGLQLHIPDAQFSGEEWPRATPPSPWKIRGANLCAWERGLNPPLLDHEIAIDPVAGRIVIGSDFKTQADALESNLLLTYTYGAVGPVGAHPITYAALPAELDAPEGSANFRQVHFTPPNQTALRDALKDIQKETKPVVIEITDSRTHQLDLTAGVLSTATITEKSLTSLALNAPLTIRAADNQRPIIELKHPLGFRPLNVASPTADPAEQKLFDAAMEKLTVRLEGVHLARAEDFPAGEPLIARAALNRLELINCTLDPGGFRKLDGTRAPILTSLKLPEPYGFQKAADEIEFKQTPEIVINRSVTGLLLLDSGYSLCLTDSVIDAGQGVGDAVDEFAVSSATNPATEWGPPTIVHGITVLGRMRVETIDGAGGIFAHALEVQNTQVGCLKFSYFSGSTLDRLPQNYACVKGITTIKGEEARLVFTSEIFGHYAYCQLALACDARIRERGPNNDEMGAFGFLRDAHKWLNLQIRYREFMPVGIRPLMIPVT
ncbi:MAG TPA: phage tail protein [Pyrinomonadaceae bacterium]|jgi:hypothetical protein